MGDCRYGPLGVRPETRPRDLVLRSRSKEPPTRGPRETRGFRGVGNTGVSVFDIRGPHEACFVGWMSAKDPDGLSGRTPRAISLVVNADDLGASRGINEGIALCHRQGVV